MIWTMNQKKHQSELYDLFTFFLPFFPIFLSTTRELKAPHLRHNLFANSICSPHPHPHVVASEQYRPRTTTMMWFPFAPAKEQVKYTDLPNSYCVFMVCNNYSFFCIFVCLCVCLFRCVFGFTSTMLGRTKVLFGVSRSCDDLFLKHRFCHLVLRTEPAPDDDHQDGDDSDDEDLEVWFTHAHHTHIRTHAPTQIHTHTRTHTLTHIHTSHTQTLISL